MAADLASVNFCPLNPDIAMEVAEPAAPTARFQESQFDQWRSLHSGPTDDEMWQFPVLNCWRKLRLSQMSANPGRQKRHCAIPGQELGRDHISTAWLPDF
jgi:hypothetical protein